MGAFQKLILTARAEILYAVQKTTEQVFSQVIHNFGTTLNFHPPFENIKT